MTAATEEEEGKPVCLHGVSTTTAIVQTEEKCPHDDGALHGYVLCESKVEDFNKKHDGRVKVLDLDRSQYHPLGRSSEYKISVEPGAEEFEFEFLNLCRTDGEYYFGNCITFEDKNCKQLEKATLRLMERKRDRWVQRLKIIRDIGTCGHQEECKFVEVNERDRLLRSRELPDLSRRSGTMTGLKGFSELLGKETLNQLEDFIQRGVIEEHHIRRMADEIIGLRVVFDENIHKSGNVETFRLMLEKWFNEEQFKLSSAEATMRLLYVLDESRCANLVIVEIGESCGRHCVRQGGPSREGGLSQI